MEEFKFTQGEKDMIKEAANVIYGYRDNKELKNYTFATLLDELGIFGKFRKESILELGTENEIVKIILLTAKSILETAEEFKKTGSLHKIAWAENREKIYNNVATQIQLFEKVNYEYEQKKLQSSIKSQLDIFKKQTEKNITALISTKNELVTTQINVNIAVKNFKDKIDKSPLDEAYSKKTFDRITSFRKEIIEFMYKKFKEEPVKLLYYRTGNGVSVKVSFGKNGYYYTSGNGHSVHCNKGTDRNEYPLIISVSYIEDFLYNNDVRDEDLLVVPESIDKFYTFDNYESSIVSANLTPSFVSNWWNYDCPDIYRKTPNRKRSVNMLGMPLCHFSDKLVESSFSEDYIDEDITEEEVRLLSKGHEDTRISKSMKSRLEAQKLKNNTKKIEVMRKEVDDFDKKVQSVIDTHRSDILAYLEEQFKDRVISKTVDAKNPTIINDLKINDDFGFDCGFLNIKAKDGKYSKTRTLLHQVDPNVLPWMKIAIPYNSQSLTLKRAEFNKIRDIVVNETGIQLYANAILD